MNRLKLVILPKLFDANGKTNELWFIYYSYRNPQTGKMHRFKIYKGFKERTKRERYIYAEAMIKELTIKLKGGWDPFDNSEIIYDDQLQYANIARVYGKKRRSNLTVDYFLSDFLKETKARVSPKSFESYQSKLRKFSQWLHTVKMANNNISVITEDVLVKFFDYLIYDRKLQGITIDKYGVNLRQFFRYLLKHKKIFTNPMPEIPKIANTIDASAKPIRKGDMVLLKNIIRKRDPQLWLAIQFEFYCFIRPGNELRNMQIRWIDFHEGTITIPAYVKNGDDNLGIAKNRVTETVLIPRPFLDVLIKDYMLDKYDRDLYVFGNNRIPGESMLGKNTLRNRFNRFRDELGLSKDYKFYSWKHTGGISASNAGIPVKDIQLQMRHKSLDITDKYLRKMKGVESEHLKNNFPEL